MVLIVNYYPAEATQLYIHYSITKENLLCEQCSGLHKLTNRSRRVMPGLNGGAKRTGDVAVLQFR